MPRATSRPCPSSRHRGPSLPRPWALHRDPRTGHRGFHSQRLSGGAGAGGPGSSEGAGRKHLKQGMASEAPRRDGAGPMSWSQGTPRGRSRAWHPWVCPPWGRWAHILLLSKVSSKWLQCQGRPGQWPQTRGAGIQGGEHPGECRSDRVLSAGRPTRKCAAGGPLATAPACPPAQRPGSGEGAPLPPSISAPRMPGMLMTSVGEPNICLMGFLAGWAKGTGTCVRHTPLGETGPAGTLSPTGCALPSEARLGTRAFSPGAGGWVGSIRTRGRGPAAGIWVPG